LGFPAGDPTTVNIHSDKPNINMDLALVLFSDGSTTKELIAVASRCARTPISRNAAIDHDEETLETRA
jgi:hypothetical protein